MLRQVALIFTVLCAELGLAARHLGDISLHGGSNAEAEAAAACELMEKNDCKFGKKKAPEGFKCVWMYDCYKFGKKEAGPVGHPSDCGAMKMQGIGVCSAVSLMPKVVPPPTDPTDEETELPSDEDIEEMEDEEEADVPEVDDAEADTEPMEEPELVTAVTPKLKENDEDEKEDEKEEDTTAEFDPDEEKPTYECGGASVHWKTCGAKEGECHYVKKADVELCGVEAWGCYHASDLSRHCPV